MKDASFLPALPVILQKRPLLKPLAKTSQPLARKLNFTALFHINATCPWNAQITASVFMTGNAPLTVLSAFPLNVPAETGLPGNFKKKKSNVYKKRADRKYLRGRTYKDYKVYMDKNPDAFVIHKIEKDKVILKPYLLKNNISQMAVSINITHLRNGI